MASLLALSPVAGAAAGERSPSIQLTWNPLSPVLQKSGEQFAYLASLSCVSLAGQACSDVVIEIPYATSDDQHPATTPIASWHKSLSASVNGVSVTNLSWTDTGTAVVATFGSLDPGQQANVTFRVVPPARTTAGGTAWTAGLEIRSSNAAGASASAIEMIAEAQFRPAVHKSLADLTPGSRVLRGTKVSYRITVGDVTGGAIGSVGLTPDASLSLTDVLPPELEFLSCSEGCAAVGQSVEWQLDQSRVPVTVTVTAAVRADAPVGREFRNTASAEFVSLVGEKASATSNSVPAVVSDSPDPHAVFRKEAVGNLGDTSPSVIGHISAQLPSSYLLKVVGQPVALEYILRDPLPCTKDGDTWVSLPRSTDTVCESPAFLTTSVTVHAHGGAVSFPRTATMTYSDGTSQTFAAARSGEVFDIPAGKSLSRIDAEGALAAGAGTLMYTVTGKPAPFAAADRFTNVAAFTIPGPGGGGYVDLSAELETHVKTGAAIGWQQTPPSSTDLTFRRMADLDPTTEGAGYNWSYVGWWPQYFSSPELRTESGAAAVILPEGFKIAQRNTSRLDITEDWGGPGQTRYILAGQHGNVIGTGGPPFNIVVDELNRPAPGVYAYDMFIGFRDRTFDQCLLMNGASESSNSLIRDTSGIIGSTDGIETTLCHLQGTLLVLGDDPGIALNKSVRSALSPQWINAPETVVEIGSDDVVEFLLAWSNPGAVPVDRAVIYDVFSRAEDDRTVTGSLRGSSLPLTLAEAPEVPEGWTVEYSKAQDPCRPEIRGAKDEVGCTDDWAPHIADVAEAAAIRFKKSEPADIGDTLLVALRFTAPPIDGAVAYNTAASAVSVAMQKRALIPLAPLETARVGAKRVLVNLPPDPDPDPNQKIEPSPQHGGGEDPQASTDELARTGADGWVSVLWAGALLLTAGGILALHRRLKSRS